MLLFNFNSWILYKYFTGLKFLIIGYIYTKQTAEGANDFTKRSPCQKGGHLSISTLKCTTFLSVSRIIHFNFMIIVQYWSSLKLVGTSYTQFGEQLNLNFFDQIKHTAYCLLPMHRTGYVYVNLIITVWWIWLDSSNDWIIQVLNDLSSHILDSI